MPFEFFGVGLLFQDFKKGDGVVAQSVLSMLHLLFEHWVSHALDLYIVSISRASHLGTHSNDRQVLLL